MEIQTTKEYEKSEINININRPLIVNIKKIRDLLSHKILKPNHQPIYATIHHKLKYPANC